ncbi:fumarylacetoacetate hydrolase family protein [Psychromonas sp. PT13]|uniref:fumarylacetoacetate hydrolase family protein n=1 Tax=Psychromonas sp. PT13 TaxID=3439547 RepID=UPI003EB6F58A
MNTIILDKQPISPSKVVCVGRNYVEHIKELNNEIPDNAVIFVKPNSAICEHAFSGVDEPIHYESEISFIIKNNHIEAVGFGLDLTKRALQSTLKAKSLPWERAKGFDRSAVFSEFVRFSGKLEDLSLQLFINDQLTQQADFDLMMYKPQQLLTEVSTFMSFSDGDILMTGTPKGVGELIAKDCLVGRIYVGDKLLIEQQWIVK